VANPLAPLAGIAPLRGVLCFVNHRQFVRSLAFAKYLLGVRRVNVGRLLLATSYTRRGITKRSAGGRREEQQEGARKTEGGGSGGGA